MAHLSHALFLRGIRVERGEHFDLTARAFGARGFLKVSWVDEGLEVRAKIKGGLFSSPAALERILLEAGRDAQTRLTYEREGAP